MIPMEIYTIDGYARAVVLSSNGDRSEGLAQVTVHSTGKQRNVEYKASTPDNIAKAIANAYRKLTDDESKPRPPFTLGQIVFHVTDCTTRMAVINTDDPTASMCEWFDSKMDVHRSKFLNVCLKVAL